jgi:hypothetical protein
LKVLKATRKPGSNHQRSDSGDIWQTSRFELRADGKLYQCRDATKQPAVNASSVNTSSPAFVTAHLELVDIQRQVSSRYFIQPADESLLSRKYVIELFCMDGRLLFLATGSAHDRAVWLHALKSMARGWLTSNIALDTSSSSPSSDSVTAPLTYRLNRILNVRIIGARGLPSSSDVYCELFAAGSRKARTNVRTKCGGEPFWREEFLFEYAIVKRCSPSMQFMMINLYSG